MKKRERLYQKNSSGSALVLVLIVILAGTVLFSYLLRNSDERRQTAAAESAKRAATLAASGRLQTVRAQFLSDLQAAVGEVLKNPNLAENIKTFSWNNHPILKPVVQIPQGDSFEILPIGEGLAGSSFKYEVNVNGMLPKIFSISYVARLDNGGVAKVYEKFVVARSSLNNFAIAYHNQPAPVQFGGPFTANGQVAMFFTGEALAKQASTGDSLIKVDTQVGDVAFNKLMSTNAPEKYGPGTNQKSLFVDSSGTHSASFDKGIAYSQGGNLSQGLIAARDSLASAPNANTVKPGQNVSYSKVFIWEANGQVNYRVDVFDTSDGAPGGQSYTPSTVTATQAGGTQTKLRP